MCGIVGVLARRDEAVPAAAVPRMNESIVHRGPDEGGIRVGPSARATIGMRRLSIIDLAGGSQPLANEDETVWLVLNGELYNYQALRAALEARGHRFRTQTDTEAAVHAYEEYGPRFVEHLWGMFAIAVLDERDGLLLLARDRLGKKPLYYAVTPDFLVFGSEIKALLASGLVPSSPDVAALDAYLAWGFVPGEGTLFAGVRELPAASVLQARGAAHEITSYWDVPVEPPEHLPTLEEATERVRALLEDAVRVRLMSDVPLGVFLSGGLDSTVVLALMTRLLDRPVEAFSIACGSGAGDELPHARLAARAFGAVHHETRLERCPPALLERVVWHHDEPPADPATVPTFELARFARRTVTVALTGEGGDELFGGYDHYRRFRTLMETEARVPAMAAIARGAGRGLALADGMASGRMRKGVWLAGLPAEARYGAWHAIFPAPDRAALRRDGVPAADGRPVDALLARTQALPPLGRFLHLDAKLSLAEQLLMKVDKMTMAASLEARCPLLDQRLFELVAPLPDPYKLSADGTKILLRRAAGAWVPPEILARPKQGFEVPLRTWLLRDLREMAGDLLLGDRSSLAPYLHPARVRALWARLERRPDALLARQLWLLLALAVWHHRHWP